MKKQILFLTFFIAAILAGTTSAFAQYIDYPEIPSFIPASVLNCAEDATELNPLPGELYTYTVQTTSVTDDVRWFVINNHDLELATPNPDSIIGITGQIMSLTAASYPGTPMAPGGPYVEPADGLGPYILALGTSGFVNYNYSTLPTGDETDNGVSATGTNEDHSIEIKWKSFDGNLENEVLLVALVSDASGCTNNIEVYRIVPVFNFTLDIAALNNDGDSISDPTSTGTDIINSCVSKIESAVYNAVDNVSGNGTLTVDYGENWAFFAINANNFVDSWMPRFQITNDLAAAAGTVTMTAQWAYASDNFAATSTQTWYDIDAGGLTTKPVVAGGLDNASAYAEFNAVGGGASSTAGGENIIVRVRLDWGTDAENAISPVTVNVAVDGVMFDPNETAASALADQFDFTNNIALKDLGEPASGPCIDDNFDYDKVDHIITPRPQILDATGTAAEPFELNTGDQNSGTLTNPNTGGN